MNPLHHLYLFYLILLNDDGSRDSRKTEWNAYNAGAMGLLCLVQVSTIGSIILLPCWLLGVHIDRHGPWFIYATIALGILLLIINYLFLWKGDNEKKMIKEAQRLPDKSKKRGCLTTFVFSCIVLFLFGFLCNKCLI